MSFGIEKRQKRKAQVELMLGSISFGVYNLLKIINLQFLSSVDEIYINHDKWITQVNWMNISMLRN